MFSKACEYGIRAAIYNADKSLLNKKLTLKDLAKAIDLIEAYTTTAYSHSYYTFRKRINRWIFNGYTTLNKLMLITPVYAIDGNNVY